MDTCTQKMHEALLISYEAELPITIMLSHVIANLYSSVVSFLFCESHNINEVRRKVSQQHKMPHKALLPAGH
jgi:hypothetical protein